MKNTMLASMISKAMFSLRRNKAEIYLATGIAAGVACTVEAVVAGAKIQKILEERNQLLETAKKAAEEKTYGDNYTEQDYADDQKKIRYKTILDILKTLAAPAALGTVAVTGVIGSHHEMKKRTMALATAYAVADKGFKEYRSRVIDKFGEEVDKKLMHGDAQNLKIDKAEKDISETTTVQQAPIYDPHSVCFDEWNSKYWDKSAPYNLSFLISSQHEANQMLQRNGHIFENEVRDILGLPRTTEGQKFGWVDHPNLPKEDRDHQIDFGFLPRDPSKWDEAKTRFVSGEERSVWLEFNVQGDILDDPHGFATHRKW